MWLDVNNMWWNVTFLRRWRRKTCFSERKEEGWGGGGLHAIILGIFTTKMLLKHRKLYYLQFKIEKFSHPFSHWSVQLDPFPYTVCLHRWSWKTNYMGNSTALTKCDAIVAWHILENWWSIFTLKWRKSNKIKFSRSVFQRLMDWF